ncbi:MAG: hypothetical protein M3495_18210 [Pseudomonadota bacterium]|nr:hypothetical protein [Gammaproteobacteria bacterium]MDQ3583417.1 hypothetical protein [Pseudomonadota bacterium]
MSGLSEDPYRVFDLVMREPSDILRAGRRTARMTRAIEGIFADMTRDVHLFATPERAEAVSKRIL